MSRVFPDIAPVPRMGRDFHGLNTVQHWGFFSREDLSVNPGKLLMLDVDFGRNCSLKCPWCFRRKHFADKLTQEDLSYEELLGVIDDARELGLQDIKICGAGEPLENQNLLRFARDLTDRNIGVAIFTKGHVIGDDIAVKHYFGRDGFTNGNDLAAAFYELKTSFLVGFQAATPAVQDALVGHVNGYTKKRNLGLERLANVGFNKNTPTRLAICTNPLIRQNYEEIFDIYIYARSRNILPVVAMMMMSGEQHSPEFISRYDVSDEDKTLLFEKIYLWNLREGVQTTHEFLRDGPSCLPGIHPCNQIAAGLYLLANGQIVRCPGDGDGALGNFNVKRTSISEIWEHVKFWKYSGQFNCGCPFKEHKTLPMSAYDAAYRVVLQQKSMSNR